MAQVRVVVLAAGKGSRAWPFGELRQKCAVPIAGKPLIAHLAEELLASGAEGLHVVVGHNAPSVRYALRQWSERVRYITQEQPTGTADAALAALEDEDFDLALVVYGDVFVTREDLRAVREAVERGEAEAAALVVPLAGERPQDWICASVGDGVVRGVEGHPRGGTHRLGGVFALRPAHVKHLRENPGIMTAVPVGGMPPREAELAQSLQMMIEDGVAVAAVEARGPCVDIDKPWHILSANRAAIAHLLALHPEERIGRSCTISDSAEISGRLVLGENVHIGKRVVIGGDAIVGENTTISNGAILGGQVVVGRNCRVEDYCKVGAWSSLGEFGIVAHCAEFAGVTFERVYLYHYCEVCGVLGRAVDIGAATVCGTLRFDDGSTVHRVKGRPEIPRVGANASYLGDHSRTGVNAILMPGVKVGCYSCVGPGVILYEDLPSGKLVLAKQQLELRDWGPERYGW